MAQLRCSPDKAAPAASAGSDVPVSAAFRPGKSSATSAADQLGDLVICHELNPRIEAAPRHHPGDATHIIKHSVDDAPCNFNTSPAPIYHLSELGVNDH